jgi:hypothetical protein
MDGFKGMIAFAGRHAGPAVIVDPGDELELAAVLQVDPAHHVHLPQLHRTLSLPTAELVSAAATTAQLGQAVAREASVDARASGHRTDADPAELVFDPPGSPAGVLAPQLTDQRFDLGRGLMRTPVGSSRAIGQGRESTLLVADDPVPHALT